MQKEVVTTTYTTSAPKYTDGILPTTAYTFLEYHMIPEPEEFNYVYRPGDDTFLLLSSLYKDIIQPIKQQSANEIKTYQDIFQLGSGSGILSAHLNKWLEKIPPLRHICVDINPDACMMSNRYFQHYSLPIQVIHSSLFNNLGHNYHPDLIIFNPPYVPTPQQQEQSQSQYLVNRLKKFQSERKFQNNMIGYSWMGGPDGLKITRKFLKTIDWQTTIYIIVMCQQFVTELLQQLKSNQHINIKKFALSFDILEVYRKYNEELFVVKITTSLLHT